MADQTLSILQALDTDIETRKATTFSYLMAHFFVNPSFFVADQAVYTPFFLVYPTAQELTPACVGIYRSNEKADFVTISAFQEYPDWDEGILGDVTAGTTGIVEIGTDIENAYDRNTLSLSGVSAAFLRSKSYGILGQPWMQTYHQVHLTFEYWYMDERST